MRPLTTRPRVFKHYAFSALSLYRIPHSDFICVLSFGTLNSLDFHFTPRSAGKLNIPPFPRRSTEVHHLSPLVYTLDRLSTPLARNL